MAGQNSNSTYEDIIHLEILLAPLNGPLESEYPTQDTLANRLDLF